MRLRQRTEARQQPQRHGLHAVQQCNQRQPLSGARAEQAARALHAHQTQADDGTRRGIGAVDAGQRIVLRVHDAARLAQQEAAVRRGLARGQPAGVEIRLGAGRGIGGAEAGEERVVAPAALLSATVAAAPVALTAIGVGRAHARAAGLQRGPARRCASPQ